MSRRHRRSEGVATRPKAATSAPTKFAPPSLGPAVTPMVGLRGGGGACVDAKGRAGCAGPSCHTRVESCANGTGKTGGIAGCAKSGCCCHAGEHDCHCTESCADDTDGVCPAKAGASRHADGWSERWGGGVCGRRHMEDGGRCPEGRPSATPSPPFYQMMAYHAPLVRLYARPLASLTVAALLVILVVTIVTNCNAGVVDRPRAPGIIFSLVVIQPIIHFPLPV